MAGEQEKGINDCDAFVCAFATAIAERKPVTATQAQMREWRGRLFGAMFGLDDAPQTASQTAHTTRRQTCTHAQGHEGPKQQKRDHKRRQLPSNAEPGRDDSASGTYTMSTGLTLQHYKCAVSGLNIYCIDRRKPLTEITLMLGQSIACLQEVDAETFGTVVVFGTKMVTGNEAEDGIISTYCGWMLGQHGDSAAHSEAVRADLLTDVYGTERSEDAPLLERGAMFLESRKNGPPGNVGQAFRMPVKYIHPAAPELSFDSGGLTPRLRATKKRTYLVRTQHRTRSRSTTIMLRWATQCAISTSAAGIRARSSKGDWLEHSNSCATSSRNFLDAK
ncbi:unnamed protein product, partial [Mesorhabditis spiculigera]